MTKKIIITTLILSLVLSLMLIKCTFTKPHKDVTIVSQELIYDSLYRKPPIFYVNLYTTLEFKAMSIKREQYNNYLLVIKKDSFPLIPDVNAYIEKSKGNSDVVKVEYTVYINFKSKDYDNDSLSQLIIRDSKIIEAGGLKVKKSKSYNFRSVIKFHKIQPTNY